MKTLGLQEGEAITHPWMNKSLEMAQKKVEARNFDIRKQILKYDDVMNDQRKVIFDQRIDIMGEDDVSETVKDMRHQVVRELVSRHIPERAYAEQWDTVGLKEAIDGIFDLDLPVDTWAEEEGIADQEILERLAEVDAKAAQGGRYQSRVYRQIEKMVLLQTLDHLWREHLVTLEHLRQVIGFRAYGQRSAERVQERGLRPVRGDAGAAARGDDRPAHARRARPARGAADAAAGRAAADGGPSRRSRDGVRRVRARRRGDRGRGPAGLGASSTAADPQRGSSG